MASDSASKNINIVSSRQSEQSSPKTCTHCYQLLPDPKPLIAHDGLEVQGLLRALEPTEDGYIIATIGALRVVYSADKEEQFRPFLGQQIASIMDRKKLIVMGREEWEEA